MRLGEERAAGLFRGFGAAFSSDIPPGRLREISEGEGTLIVAADPATHKVLLMLSSKDVASWGEVAMKQPREIARQHLEAGEAAEGFVGRELARRAGFTGQSQARVETLVGAAHRMFLQMECVWVEVGFVTTREGVLATRVCAEVDANAAFRHPGLEGAPSTALAPLPRTEREKAARAAGIEYVELGGDLGVLPGGIGFGLAAVDIIRRVGGNPANLMDSGGEATPQRIGSMMDLLLDDPRVQVVFGCRYAGLTRLDGWARMMIQYILDKRPSKPIVLRIAGNAEEEARRLFDEAAQLNPQPFSRVWVFFSNTPVDNAAREAVALVDMIRKGEDPFAQGGA